MKTTTKYITTIRCDFPHEDGDGDEIECPSPPFVTASFASFAHEQARGAGWERIVALKMDIVGYADRKIDICPSDALAAKARVTARTTRIANQREAQRTARLAKQKRQITRAERRFERMWGTQCSRLASMERRIARDHAAVPPYPIVVTFAPAFTTPPTCTVSSPFTAPTSDVTSTTKTEGASDHADRPHQEHQAGDPRQSEADEGRDQGRRRSPRRPRADRGSATGPEHRDDADAREAAGRTDKRAARARAGAANAPTVTILGQIEKILRGAAIPLTVKEITARATGDLALPTKSQTPRTIVSRDLALDIKAHGDASRFVRTAPGTFALRVQNGWPTTHESDCPKLSGGECRCPIGNL